MITLKHKLVTHCASKRLLLALLDFWDCSDDASIRCWFTLAAHATITKAVSSPKQGQRESF